MLWRSTARRGRLTFDKYALRLLLRRSRRGTLLQPLFATEPALLVGVADDAGHAVPVERTFIAVVLIAERPDDRARAKHDRGR